MSRAKALFVVALLLGVAASLMLLRPRHADGFFHHFMKARFYSSATSPENDAYRADLNLLIGGLSSSQLIHLTDAQESASDILAKMDTYQALVVVTAGKGGPTRRTEKQPFVSISPDTSSARISNDADLKTASIVGDGSFQNLDNGAISGPLAALEGPVGLMNGAAEVIERVLGRPLFPITLSLFDRKRGGSGGSNGGPYAIFDASAGLLLLDRQFVATTWSYDMLHVSYLTHQLSGRVFHQAASLLLDRGVPYRKRPMYDNGNNGHGGDDGAVGAWQAMEKKEAGASAAGTTTTAAAATRQLLMSSAATATATTDVSEVDVPGAASTATAAGAAAAAAAAVGTPDSSAPPSGAAAAALNILAAAVAAALPAAFAIAPPLWFCVLCPTVLGLLAPVLINLALNQIAGALCSQLHLTDEACFDVTLGALGAGFVLSLASAVPIFFVCRLPQCAGRNVSEGLRGMCKVVWTRVF